MTIAELRRYRESLHISQLELWRRTGVNNRRICMAERGHIVLREDELAALENGMRAVLRNRERQLNSSMVRLGVSHGQVALTELVGADPEGRQG